MVQWDMKNGNSGKRWLCIGDAAIYGYMLPFMVIFINILILRRLEVAEEKGKALRGVWQVGDRRGESNSGI